jgi:N6-L-threonylcarbamoyladenine synthase
LESALEQSGLGWNDLDAVAATYGPGLAGSLLVGLTAGKTMAMARGLPFLGVNHLEAHIYANWLREETTSPPGPLSREERGSQNASAGTNVHQGGKPDSFSSFSHIPLRMEGEPEAAGEAESWPGDPSFPLLALVISGAHSELVHIPYHGRYELLGQTRDDAAGEAFDKVARVLGLGYPGGPAIERAAASRPTGAKNPYRLPRAWLNGTRDFSFSGLKTAVVQLVEGYVAGEAESGASKYAREGVAAAVGSGALSVPDVAAAFQESVVDVLATKTLRAARDLGVRQVLLAGGVAANKPLRERLRADLAPLDIRLSYPPIAFCTDNAAMIAAAAYFHLRHGERSPLDLDVRPGLQLPFAG